MTDGPVNRLGVALLIWLTVEIVIVGYTTDPPLQPFYLVLGAAITVVGLAWLAEGGSSLRDHARPEVEG